MTPDNIERRGRWRGQRKRIVNIYMDLSEPIPDALVASALSGGGGPCKYVLNCSDDVNIDTVVNLLLPGIPQCMGSATAKVLCAALLWFESQSNPKWDVPQYLSNHINSMRLRIGTLPTVSRVPIIVGCNGDQLIFYDFDVLEQPMGHNIPDSSSLNSISEVNRRITQIQGEVRNLKRRIEELYSQSLSQINQYHNGELAQLKRLSSGIRRLGMMRVIRSKCLL